jgi:hypothetical protein
MSRGLVQQQTSIIIFSLKAIIYNKPEIISVSLTDLPGETGAR